MRELTRLESLALVGKLLSGARSLSKAPYLDAESIRLRQLAQLKALVAHACAEIPFYRDLYRSVGFAPGDLRSFEDFRRLPTVSKDDVIANYPHAMLKAGARPDDYTISRSSGSSGKVLDIAYDQQAMLTFIVAGLRLYRMGFAYAPWHSQAYIYTSAYPLDSLFGMYPMRFHSTLAPLEEVADALRAKPPHLLVCYPSHLKQLAQVLGDEGAAALRLRAISTNSEMSTQAERDFLARVFGCPVLDEYSSEELTRIAAQCLHKSYHVFDDINYMEVLDDAGDPTDGDGTLVGTNLHNFAMPMIRYRQNDLGRIGPSSCACGRTFRVLTNLEGRRNDSFTLPSGKVLTSGFLLDATYEFLLTWRGAVRDFCLIQEAADQIVLQVVPGADWSDAIAAAIRERFEGFLEPAVRFSIQTVAVCEKSKTGKRNPIINRMTRAG